MISKWISMGFHVFACICMVSAWFYMRLYVFLMVSLLLHGFAWFLLHFACAVATAARGIAGSCRAFFIDFSRVSQVFQKFQRCLDPFGSVRTVSDAFGTFGCIRMCSVAYGKFGKILHLF